MTVMSDSWIIEQNKQPLFTPMIENFQENPVRYVHRVTGEGRTTVTEEELPKYKKVISYGVTSFGYDVRLTNDINEIKIFSNILSPEINPKKITEANFATPVIRVDEEGSEYVLIPPHSYLQAPTVEYFRIPKDILVIVLGKSTYARCFSGDTRVALTDDTEPTFLELIERSSKGERLFGYSVDNNLNVTMAELILPRKIGNEKLVEVVLDSGKTIKCTPDHKFITRDGLEIEAKDLEPGTSLFPLYKVTTPKDYDTVSQPANGWKFDFAHKLADDWNLRRQVYKFNSEESARHHKDHNRQNNYPDNIVRMTPSAHSKHHNKINAKNETIRRKISEGNKKYWEEKSKDPKWLNNALNHIKQMSEKIRNGRSGEIMKRHSEKLKQYWESERGLADKEIKRQTQRLIMRTEERRKQSSEILSNLWKDPEFKSMMVEQAKNLNTRTDITEKEVIEVLEIEGSIRGASRRLNCDRTVFRRFTEIIAEYKQKWADAKVTCDEFYDAMVKHGSATKAAIALGVSRSYAKRHFQEAVKRYYGSPVADSHKVVEVKHTGESEDVYCLTAPEFGNFALADGVFVNNCALICNSTPVEPEFEGNVVIEIANVSSSPVRCYLNEGIAQFCFIKGNEACRVSYKDKAGKYQGQTGLTFARV